MSNKRAAQVSMSHSGYKRRYKDLQAVQEMIQQYEEQIAESEDEVAKGLMKQAAKRLKQSIENG